MRALPPAQSISILLLSLTASFLSSARPAGAALFAVTRGDDPSPGPCNAGDCSLREAVLAANAAPGSTITLPAGTYTLTIPGSDGAASNAAIGDLDIFVATTLTGAGASTTFVQSGEPLRAASTGSSTITPAQRRPSPGSRFETDSTSRTNPAGASATPAS